MLAEDSNTLNNKYNHDLWEKPDKKAFFSEGLGLEKNIFNNKTTELTEYVVVIAWLEVDRSKTLFSCLTQSVHIFWGMRNE